jgi:hypothetical protein
MNLTVDTANRQLTGPMTGSVKSGGVTTAVKQNLALDIPPPMDGTWTLAFQLTQSGTAVTGTALLTLSNGVDYAFAVKGKTGANGTAVLTLTGDKTDPAAKAIKIRTTITPLEGGWARIETFSGRAYGQTVAWHPGVRTCPICGTAVRPRLRLQRGPRKQKAPDLTPAPRPLRLRPERSTVRVGLRG